jgi:hypothetical protein
MKGASVPLSFVKPNKDLLHGLDVFIQSLTERNIGLASHSSAKYEAGLNLLEKSLSLQRSAIAEYPAYAHISL